MASKGKRKGSSLALIVVAVLVLGGVVGWAVSKVFAVPPEVSTEKPYTLVELVDGEVGSSINLTTSAKWQANPVGTNRAVGTVTSLAVAPGDVVSAGQALYAVDLRPVVVASGETPAFRAMSRGVEGADVVQLQQLLTALGHYVGATDGDFNWATDEAVRDWQSSAGMDDSGVVQLGDIVFVPNLPGRFVIDGDQIYRGATLSGGERAISALSPEPSFTLTVTTTQAAMMPAGTPVEIDASGASWPAVVTGHSTSSEAPDSAVVSLGGPEETGGSICRADCGLIPPTGDSALPSRVVTQATVSGVVAPAAALLSTPDGSVALIDQGGALHEVEVVATAKGMSVLNGARAGLKVRLPATINEGE